MPSRENMEKIAISLTETEKDFVSGRAAELSVTSNEYLRRLISLGHAICSLRDQPADKDFPLAAVDITIVATQAGKTVRQHIVSDLMI